MFAYKEAQHNYDMVIFWVIRDNIQKGFKSIVNNSSTRILAIISVSISVFLLFLVVYSYNSQLATLRIAELNRLKAVVQSTALNIDGDAHARLTSTNLSQDDIKEAQTVQAYDEIHHFLLESALVNDFESDMYTLFQEGGQLKFAVTSGEKPYYRHAWTDAHKENFDHFESGTEFGPYEDEHGTWLSAFTPIKNSDGHVVAILQADCQFDSFICATRISIGKNLLFLLLGIGLMMWFMMKSVMRILKKEELLYDRIVEQNDTIKVAQEETMASIRYAKNIQFATLPDQTRMSDIFEGDFFVLFKPRDIVSGDFFWVHQRGDDRV